MLFIHRIDSNEFPGPLPPPEFSVHQTEDKAVERKLEAHALLIKDGYDRVEDVEGIAQRGGNVDFPSLHRQIACAVLWWRAIEPDFPSLEAPFFAKQLTDGDKEVSLVDLIMINRLEEDRVSENIQKTSYAHFTSSYPILEVPNSDSHQPPANY